MPQTKRPRIPDDQLSPQELKKRKDNTESQRRRRRREQEKSKNASNNEHPLPSDGGPTGHQAGTLRDNVPVSELDVAVAEPSITASETLFGPNLNSELMENGDCTRLYCGTLR